METGKIGAVLYSADLLYKKPMQYSSKNNNLNNEHKKFEFPSYNFYNAIAFTGGKSMNLADTKRQLDKYNAYPSEGLREEINETLEKGNPDKKLLLDIHREYYSDLKDCKELSDVTIYDEFKDVLSDSDKRVSYQKGSFIDKVKHGEIKGFDPDTDVSLQLLQLYWGEGFSLTALQKEYGQNIDGVLDKLQIPKVNRVYGQYLKLSDKDYNDKFSAFMSQRAKEIEHKKSSAKVENKSAESTQEAASKTRISSPGRPMSEEHKQAIREGIKRGSIENPEKIAELTSSKKEFFEKNPEESERFSQVLLRAWSYKEADSIKKSMSKFMKKNYVKNSEDLINDTRSNVSLKDFWDKNNWARKRFSLCMKKSWARQEELSQMGLIYEPLFVGTLMPKSLIKELSKDLQMPDLQNGFQYIIKDPREKEHIEETPKIYEKPILVSSIIDDNLEKYGMLYHKWGTAMSFGIHKTIEKYKSSGKDIEQYEQLLKVYMEESKSNQQMTPLNFYKQFIETCQKNGDIEFIKEVDDNINSCFDKLKDKNAMESIKYLTKEYDSLLKKYYGKRLAVVEF